MLLYFLPVMLVIAILVYLRQRPQWKKSLLVEGEAILFEQIKTKVIKKEGDKEPIQMGWVCVRITNKRIFFLYPDKRAIFKILDFSGNKDLVYDERMRQNVFYLEKAAMKIEADVKGMMIWSAKAIGGNGAFTQFRFLVKDVTKLKDALGI